MLAIGIAAMMLLIAVSFSSAAEGGPSGNKVLFDMGNGRTIWADIESEPGDTIGDVLTKAAGKTDGIYDHDFSSGAIRVNGVTSTVIGDGSNTGSLTASGTTSVTVVSKWSVYLWDGSKWTRPAGLSMSDPYTSADIAVAFYPVDPLTDVPMTAPSETPLHPYSWTMVRGNAEQTGGQSYVPSSASEVSATTDIKNGFYGVYASVLTVQGYAFVKYGSSLGSYSNSAVRCYTPTGSIAWEFEYPCFPIYETSTPLIVGEYIFVQSGLGYIFKFPWKDGPGIDNANVTTFNGTAWNLIDFTVNDLAIPTQTMGLTDYTGFTYQTGPGSMVFDSGCIFVICSNGMVYCFDMNLKLVWSRQMGGHAYYLSPTVFDGYVSAGALNGVLYIMDKKDGKVLGSDEVYTITIGGGKFGSVSSAAVFRTGTEKYRLMFSVTDGRGMDSVNGGIGIYEFDPNAASPLRKISVTMDAFGMVANYVQPVVNSEFQGIYFTSAKGLFNMKVDGTYKLLNASMYDVRAPPTLVNGNSIFLVSYPPSKPIYQVDLDGKIISMYTPKSTINNYGMSPVVIIEGKIFYGNDSGLMILSGTLPKYIEPVSTEKPWWYSLVLFLAVIAVIIAAIYGILRFKGIKRPFAYLRGRMSHYLGGDDLRHNTKSKHRLLVMIIAGAVVTLLVAIVCFCAMPKGFMSPGEMFSSLFSAVSKGGSALNYNEMQVFDANLPRTLAALLVGIGLSVAGCMYQAIIRNPLVDPYIMGVSAGAGTAAVAVIAFNFTFFGLFSAHSVYLTAACAIVGGILAFFATMLIAEKSGGTSINYVLAGIVIGLAISSLQTLMLSMAGNTVGDALRWLFGSFANVTWDKVRVMVFPVIALAIVPLFWAKEFNLVLLGEDQARQMGLNVRKFSRLMLIIASVLTAFCVAFVGIIGFVGLVIPHLCRMILGGDHRLVIPASIATGGALMMIADLIARTAYFGQELPVGAITTMIGVPVFAYLLIKRGKLYEG
jgi:iron complex transport system permease protein